MTRRNPFVLLVLARMRELLREPEVVFWVFIFPILLAVGLGVAFRNKPPDEIVVGVVAGDGSDHVVWALSPVEGFRVVTVSAEEAAARLRLGKIALVVVPGASYEYRYDPTRPDSVLARSMVDAALQKAAGRQDPVQTRDKTITDPGARYIDFLIPGLLGMNLMGGGMWGIGFVVVDMR